MILVIIALILIIADIAMHWNTLTIIERIALAIEQEFAWWNIRGVQLGFAKWRQALFHDKFTCGARVTALFSVRRAVNKDYFRKIRGLHFCSYCNSIEFEVFMSYLNDAIDSNLELVHCEPPNGWRASWMVIDMKAGVYYTFNDKHVPVGQEERYKRVTNRACISHRLWVNRKSPDSIHQEQE